MLRSKDSIETPIPFTITIFRDLDGAVCFRDSSGEVHVAQGYHGVFRITNPKFKSWNNLTGDILEVLIFTSNEFIFELIKQSQIGINGGMVSVIGGGGRGPRGPQGPQGRETCLTDVTYAQLVSLIGSNGLSQGCNYRITDFRTRERIPNTADIILGPIEPLIVQASSPNAIHENAISQTYPSDDILYEVFNSTTSADDKGRIYFRIDNIMNVSTWYNWRVILFRRWETIPGSGIFTILTDNGGEFLDYYTFNNSPTAANVENMKLGQITNDGIAVVGAPTDKLNNFIFNSGIIFDNDFSNDCFNSTLNSSDAIIGNRIKSVFAFNTLISSKLFANNNIGIFCFFNSLGDDFSNNNIESNCVGNQIGDNFSNNDIHDNFSNNTIGNLCQDNIFGDSCSGNIIGDTCQSNDLGDDFTNNIVLDSFMENVIANECTNNIFTGNGCRNNVILNDFQSNTNIGADFRKNHIETGLNGVNFTGATHVYNNYTFTINQRSDGVYRGIFFDAVDDASGKVTYVAPNA